MAKKTVLVEDLTGAEVDEADVVKVPLSFDGFRYELDLLPASLEKLREVLGEFLQRAKPLPEPTPESRKRKSPGPSGLNGDTVRAWARSQGIEVSDLGRLSGAVIAQYKAAHGL